MSESEDTKKVSGRPGGGAYKGPEDYLAALSRGRTGATDDPLAEEMRHNRRVNGRRTASHGNIDVTFATGRPVDPMFYWKQSNLPYDVTKPDELSKVRAYCKLLYLTHPVVASAVDVFSKYPLTGMELSCRDSQLTDFYTTLFFDQLNYEEFLVDVGKEHWIVGEAWPLGSFNESLGVWEDDELLNPDDIDVIRSPFLKEPRFQMALPESIRRIIAERSPKWEFEALMRAYPELKNFTGDNARMPVSNVLLKQIRFKADTFHPRGIPILLRGFRAVMQEEMLNAAQDAVASRMYTPLLLAKLGASATDLGTSQPWIPTPGDMEDFEEALDAALAADFRVLTHHFAVSMENVFGREMMPNFSEDFDRLTDRILQVFGMSKTMLSGSAQGETYAADAMNRDLISQLLTGYQRQLKRFVRERMLVVAEAQEHYDYEVRGGKRYPIMEEVLEVDPESGESRIVEQPKLLVPDLHFKAMCLALGTQVSTPSGPRDVESLRVGDIVISWDGTDLVERPIVQSSDNGDQTIYRLVTCGGRTIDVTEEHPFWTPTGWEKALHLQVGDKLRVATNYLPQHKPSLTQDESYFLGLMIGDGGMTTREARISNIDPEILHWVEEFVNTNGCLLTKVDDRCTYRIARTSSAVPPGKGWTNPNPIITLLKRVGMMGSNAHTKRVPSEVWGSGPDAWAAFLSGYLDTDGTTWQRRHGSQGIRWTSVSQGLLEDCQTLLAFLGIRSRLAHHSGQEDVGSFWYLDVSTKSAVARAQEVLRPLVGRKNFLTWGVEYLRKPVLGAEVCAEIRTAKEAGASVAELMERFGVGRSTIYRVLRAEEGYQPGGRVDRADVAWDEILSIQVLPQAPTWSLGVAELHNHVTNGLVTHNTMKSESDQRQFYEALRASGVPISMKSRLVNVPLDLTDEIDLVRDEQVDMAVAAQETRKATYLALSGAGLPIPDDLRADFEPVAMGAEEPSGQAESQALPSIGNLDVNDSALVPTIEEQGLAPGGNVVRLPRNPSMNGEGRTRPPESDEMRAGMPRPASLVSQDDKGGFYTEALTPAEYGEDGEVTKQAAWDHVDIDSETSRLLDGPRHIGIRRFAQMRGGDGELLPLESGDPA